MTDVTQASVACPVCATTLPLATQNLPRGGAEFICSVCRTPFTVSATGIKYGERSMTLSDDVRDAVARLVGAVSAASTRAPGTQSNAALEGSLDKLPIADVLQLLRANRKSGLLKLVGAAIKGD